ncbi:hypothetical protein [Caldivirga maquilingensis]|uniref:Uncharacterized protein n=1 Tax=Caldivirga maquilingensis (strain ATCC 700844 / DSM 13496 / JCM 10307 / IC-167) TaxID=397948 RepID=A8MD40_CALMQ|nr:hypothetical protein [Caldivirga maquilingensis]ABW01696.1 hypothetical protein Cmaq_0861 [Caldivirga maquilingensis IC-167]
MLRVEYYKSQDEAINRLKEIADDAANMITKINTTIEYIKSNEARTISQGVLTIKSYNVLDQKGRELYRLLYIGIMGNVDYESLNQLRHYYVTLSESLNSLMTSMSRMNINGHLIIIYLDEVPIMIIHSLSESTLSDLINLINPKQNSTSGS